MKTPENKEKVIISDHFLKREVYKSIMTRIKSQNLKNIVIIGGSHSGYSCAWMMLHGPTSYNKHNFLGTVKWPSFPESYKYRGKDCQFCCVCPRIAACECPCNCLGSEFEYTDFDFDYNELPQFEEGNIKILYRDKIRVFYDSCREA